MKKRIVSVMLAIALMFLMMPTTSFADSYGDYEYANNGDGTCTITGYTGSGGNVEIQGELNGLTVKNIGNYSFHDKSLTAVTIPGSVEGIGDGAFGSNALTSISIPNSVTTIGRGAFGSNNLQTVVIGSGVTSIGSGAFNNNQISSVTGGGTSDGIIFARKNDASVDDTTIVSYGGASDIVNFIPSSVKNIGHWAFMRTGLTSVTIPEGIESIDVQAFHDNALTSVTIPNSVISLGSSVFSNNSLESVTILSSLTTIESEMFQHNSLSSVTIPTSVKSIGDRAFDSNSLTTLTVPDSVTSIGSAAFCDNSLETLTLGSSITSIDTFAFSTNSLTSVTIPNSVESIGYQAFYNNSLESVTLGTGLKDIGNMVFNKNQITSVTGGGTSDGIIFGRHEDCSIDDSVIASYGGAGKVIDFIPASVTEIEKEAFDSSSLTSVTIPGNVRKIGDYAFAGNSLTSISLPQSVTYIGVFALDSNAFSSFALPTPSEPDFLNWKCGSSTYNGGDSVSTSNNDPYEAQYEQYTITADDITYTTNGTELTITGYTNLVKKDIVIPSQLEIGATTYDVSSIGYNAFRDKSLTSVTIPSSVESIRDRAFGSNALTAVSIPDSVTSIGSNSFNDNSLTTVTIGSGVTSIGSAAFNNNQITSVTGGGTSDGIIFARKDDASVDDTTIVSYGGASDTVNFIPSSVKNIGDWAFRSNGLTSVTIPGGVTSIGNAAFNDNHISSVTGGGTSDGIIFARKDDASVDDTTIVSYGGTSNTIDFISDNVTSIGERAFLGNGITSVTIPSSVMSLGMYAFSDNLLTSVYIPDSVTSMGDGAFFSNELTSARISAGLTQINEGAFCENSLTSVTIPGNIVSIEDSAFSFNSLESVTIMDGVERVNSLTFADNSLTEVSLPDSIVYIGENAFIANSFTTFTLPTPTASTFLNWKCGSSTYNGGDTVSASNSEAYEAQFQVPDDTTLPLVNSATILTGSVEKGGTISVSLDVTEEDTGVTEIQIVLYAYNEDEIREISSNVIEYSEPHLSGTIEVDIDVPLNAFAGTYRIGSIHIGDQAGNLNYYSDGYPQDGYSNDGTNDYIPKYTNSEIKCIINGGGTTTVISTGDEDITFPLVNSATILTDSVEKGGTVSVSLDVTEEDTGVTEIQIVLYAYNGDERREISSNVIEYSEPYLSGTIEVDIDVPLNAFAGTYRIGSIHIGDQAGNLNYYFDGSPQDGYSNDGTNDYIPKYTNSEIKCIINGEGIAFVAPTGDENNFLRGCGIEFGDENRTFWDSVWGEQVVDKAIIEDSTINLQMPNYFTQFELTPYTSDRDNATYKIFDGATLLSDNASYVLDNVSIGTVTLTVEVTAQNTEKRNYTVNITRANVEDEAYPLEILFTSEHGVEEWFEPSFDKHRYTYDITIENSVINANVFVYPMDADATYKIYHNDILLETDQSATIDFTIGTNKVDVVLTSQSSIERTYTFLINRKSASLVDLVYLSAECVLSNHYLSGYSGNCLDFNNNIIDYNLDLPNSANDIVFDLTLADSENAAVVVKNGTSVLTFVEGTGYQAGLDVGLNVFTFEVSHPSLGYTKTYTVNVTRAVSSNTNADLCNLFKGGKKLKGFDSQVISYNQYEKYSSAVYLLPVVADSAATYKVYKDGALVSDNTPPGHVGLNNAPLPTVFTIEVTAADGVTKKVYTVTVSRVGYNAELSSLAFRSNDDTYYGVVLQDGVYTYAFDTAYDDSTLHIETYNNDNEEIVIYDGGTLIWQEGMGDKGDVDFNLDPGMNTFTIEVTAEDGVTQNTYTINITRMSAPAINNANICNFFLYIGGAGGWGEYGDTFSADTLSYSYAAANLQNRGELYFVHESKFATSEVYLNGYLMEKCGYDLSSCALNNVPFGEGENLLEIVVTAQNGTTSKTYTFNITRASSTLVGLEMISEPSKQEYLDGEALDLTGLSILANFSSGDMKMLDGDDVIATGFNSNTPGNKTITLTYQDKNISYDVSVSAIPVSSVTLSSESETMHVDDTVTLTAVVLPDDATNPEVTWSSSNTDAATVNQSGLVTAVGLGESTITATADGVSDTCVITVEAIPVSSVTLSSESETMHVDDTVTLTAVVLPDDATNPQVTWSSSNTDAATVDQSGLVTAVGLGESTITATADGKSDTCVVTVTQPVTGVSLDKETDSVNIGNTTTLAATVSPSDASNKDVTWSSDNESVATVADGVVTGISKGTATITVTTVDGGFTDTCAITVTKAVTGVSLDKETDSVNIGEVAALVATVSPSDASNKDVTWFSDNNSVATVVDGIVTGVSKGTATITVTTVDGGFTDTCVVTVTKAVTGVSLDKETDSVNIGNTTTLAETVNPSDASNKDVTWSSDDESVATVVDGVVTGVSKGTATITVTTVDGGFTDTCVVTVTKAVTGVSLDKETDSVNIENTTTLTATVSPSDASNKDVTWFSDNNSVATVVDGIVTGVSKGTATITVTTVDGGFTDTCVVTVTKAVTGVSLDKETDSVNIGNTTTLAETVSPSDASNKDVTWSSDNNGVATVADGVVTGVSKGTATITVTTEDGGYTDTCVVTVTKAVTGVSLDKETGSVSVGNTTTLAATVSPTDAGNKDVTWSSSNNSVATVADGVVTGVSVGTATITVTTVDGGYTDTCEITVTHVPVTGVSIRWSTLTVYAQTESLWLMPTVYPENASNKNLVWTSSDSSVVAVYPDGAISPLSSGTATITATTEDGGFTATCVVTVKERKIESNVYSIDNTYISGIAVNTSVEQLKANLLTDASDIKIFDASGAENTGGTVTTGMKVKFFLEGDVADELTIIILGDANGDGKISITDYTLARLDILGLKELGQVGAKAADINGDGKVSITDYTLMRLDILGLKKIH